jgi:hypothetical protein
MMRVGVLEHGHTFGQKIFFRIIKLVSGFAAPDVVRTLMYRKAFFGQHQSQLTQLVMRGESKWTVGERELFAAYVSRLNQCVF